MDIKSIFALFGGLALFVYGMQQMGEGLQKSAGDKMRNFLAMLTGTPLRGVIVGELVTMIMQSSSATTVMVIGFTGAGLMSLTQAIGVIMGANIGTTMTAWIVAAKIDEYAWLFVAVGFILMFAVKKPKIRYIGQIIFAFGTLFVGLNSMGAAMKPLAKSQAFADLLIRIKDTPVLGLLVGSGVTMVVQSSSASIGVLQTLAGTALDEAGTPLVSLYQAIPILFGSNIGTTITALLAAIGASRVAKRAAAAHTIFNVFGSVVFMLLLRPYTSLVNSLLGLIGHDLIADSNTGLASMMTPIANYMRESIAISHTVFNVINTVVWLPFVWLLAKIVRLVVPGEDPVVEKKLAYIDYKVINNPAIAIDLATKELARMTEIAMQMTQDSHQVIKVHSDELETRIFSNEDTLDYLENEIVRYLSNIIMSASMTPESSSRIAALMHAANDIERIGDYCSNICDNSLQMKNAGIVFSPLALNDLDQAYGVVEDMVRDSITALRNSDIAIARRIIANENQVDEIEEKLRASHMERLDNGTCNPQSTVIFLELIHTVERISDHCRNIAEVVDRGANYLVHSGIKD
ncbi:MAG: Na/Pi cotransporter family protein [Clostridiaceae bacterium]|nr:Na/Pi cotransporter family protein [Clostridiaceae bacterium]